MQKVGNVHVRLSSTTNVSSFIWFVEKCRIAFLSLQSAVRSIFRYSIMMCTKLELRNMYCMYFT